MKKSNFQGISLRYLAWARQNRKIIKSSNGYSRSWIDRS